MVQSTPPINIRKLRVLRFARQGFRDDELVHMAETATLLGNVSELDLEESMSILTSGVKTFNIEAENSVEIIDSLNEIDNNFAVKIAALSSNWKISQLVNL
ncbi:phage tail tape measure protein [Bacillus sp. Marseille-P3800]|uniref:phage tail tape measure protein n=1 Tax=Bacillus sp. Marseille-P3800 TaxID=2014782 RepID=UPI000C084DE3|nr:phage tail tape measure protein [Bacillus sp. Marseille-P3800]